MALPHILNVTHFFGFLTRLNCFYIFHFILFFFLFTASHSLHQKSNNQMKLTTITNIYLLIGLFNIIIFFFVLNMKTGFNPFSFHWIHYSSERGKHRLRYFSFLFFVYITWFNIQKEPINRNWFFFFFLNREFFQRREKAWRCCTSVTEDSLSPICIFIFEEIFSIH